MSTPTDPYIESPEDEFDYESDWVECLDTNQPGGGGHAAVTEQEEVLVGYIPFNKVRSARLYWLGYSYCDTDAPYALHREPPAVHPVSPSLRAYSFSYQGFVPKSNDANPDGEAYVESPFEGAMGESLYYSGYQLAICTIRFRSWGRCRFLPDADIDGYEEEWYRYTNIHTSAQLDLLQTDGSANMVFAEGAVGAPQGIPFPVPVPLPVAKLRMTILWRQVPHNYLSNDDNVLNPEKIYACLGCVNSDTFLDQYAPGTVAMLEAPEFTEVLYPVQSFDPTDYPISGWDVSIKLSIFDQVSGVLGSSYMGHLLQPWRTTRKWYHVTSDGTPSGASILPSVPFMKMFQNVADLS